MNKKEAIEKLEASIRWWADSEGRGLGERTIIELAYHLYDKGYTLPSTAEAANIKLFIPNMAGSIKAVAEA